MDATIKAETRLREVPGLYERASEMLIGILETAEHLRRLHGREFDLSSWLRLHVGGHVVTYTVDLDHRRAHILSVELAKADQTAA